MASFEGHRSENCFLSVRKTSSSSVGPAVCLHLGRLLQVSAQISELPGGENISSASPSENLEATSSKQKLAKALPGRLHPYKHLCHHLELRGLPTLRRPVPSRPELYELDLSHLSGGDGHFNSCGRPAAAISPKHSLENRLHNHGLRLADHPL